MEGRKEAKYTKDLLEAGRELCNQILAEGEDEPLGLSESANLPVIVGAAEKLLLRVGLKAYLKPIARKNEEAPAGFERSWRDAKGKIVAKSEGPDLLERRADSAVKALRASVVNVQKSKPEPATA